MTHGDRLLERRYRLVRAVKTGAGVQTFLAEDIRDGTRTIVKTARAAAVSSAVQMRLEHEAEVLRSLVGGHDLPRFGRDDDLVYLIQRFVPGASLDKRLAYGPLALPEVLTVVIDILRTVETAHERGVLHRDIKPANVVVDPGTPLRWAVLVDFGLARSGRLDEPLREEAVGTARYVAPEQAGLLDVPVDERADLYSIGALLFECLAGRPPFQGANVGEVLRQHLSEMPPELRSLGVDVPRAVDAVVQRLLRKDPSDRYQSAGAVLADLDDIAAALASGVTDPHVVIGLRDRRHTLTEPAFVGRQAELALLTSELEQASHGHGGLALVQADSGGGKTRLLDELAQQAAQRGAWVVRGQAVDQAAQRPFQLLEGVAHGLLAAVESDGALAAAVADRVGDHAEAVAAALPALAPVFGNGGEVDVGPEAYGEARSLTALPVLLDALGSESRPALVLLDDCQWADEVTIRLLDRWQRQARVRGTAVVVVAAFRSEEVDAGHPLRALRPELDLTLGPLADDDVRSLAESMAGPLPEEAAQTVIRLSEGSPFMASAVLRGLMECGALIDTAEGWQTVPHAMAGVHTSRRAAAFLIRRLELLSADALELLSVGAVLGKEFDLPFAVSLSGQPPSRVVPALDDARRRHILWVDEEDERCQFVHDKLREALLERMPPATRERLHLAAAERIERTDPKRVFELAYHFDSAAEPVRALPYALAAAAQARSQHALGVAEAQYRLAERAAEAVAGDDTRRQAAEGLGDVLSLRGCYDEASEKLRRARDLAADEVSRAQLDWRLGEVDFRRGDVASALSELEQGLRRLGCRVPKRKVFLLLATLREVFVQALHCLLPGLFVGRRDTAGAEVEFVAIRIYSRLAYVHWFHSGKVACAWAHLREMNLAERYPPTLELAQAYSEHAPVMTMVPWYSRGIAYAERSLVIRKSFEDVWGQGQSLHFYGVVLYAASRYHESLDKLLEAVRLLERTGDQWEVNTARWHMAFARYRLGELDRAVEQCRRLYVDAMEIGDQAAAGISLSGWSRASDGQVPADLVATHLGGSHDDAHTATEVHVAEAVRRLADNRYADAVAVLETARGIVRRAGLRQEYVAPVLPWLATALRMQAEHLPVYAPRHRDRLLRRAARVAAQAGRISRSYRNNLPHALRERGLVAAQRGRARRARRCLDRSLAVAADQGARYEQALTLRARGEVGALYGWPDAPTDRSAGEQQLDTMLTPKGRDEAPSQDTLSLADRFAALLEVGRRVAAAPSAEGVWEAVREAALTLLRGERCHVIELVAGDPDAFRGDTAVDDLSRTLIRRAVASGVPVVSDEALAAEASESLVLSGARSVLCAPIQVEGKPAACFYVVHGQVGGLFGREEERMAAFVATLAGAALENVAGSEARFRSLAQNSTDVITIVTAEGVVDYQSSSVTRMFGYDATELLGRPLSEWVHPDDAARFDRLLDGERLAHGGSTIVECRLRTRGGAWRYAEVGVSNLLDDPGVHGVVLNARDVTERKVLEEELRRQASHDSLTGLANRALFTDRVAHAHARHGRHGGQSAVLFLDLDDFKVINDSFGHNAGDALLAGVAERLALCVRPEDTVSRFGGDEFAILLEDSDEGEAVRVAFRIGEQLSRPFEVLGHDLRVRVSMGIATGSGDPEEVIANADAAMYSVKGQGKGSYAVFRPEMRAAAVERSTLKSQLESAFAHHEFELYYQPIVDLATTAPIGVEALLRWRHPERGLLEPSEFIALAEESGLIASLGRWVLVSACLQMRTWETTLGVTNLEVACNVAPRQLLDGRLADDVRAALAVSQLAPERLTLEITENATVGDSESAIAKLDQVKALGVRVAIDDFGMGYSSLSYLRRLPVDLIKLDKSFVDTLTRSGLEPPVLVEAIVQIGRTLGLCTVAEGIEEPIQHERLQAMGCERGQGFHYARPGPAGEIGRFLQRWRST
ncbi:MAG TPA: EAL domain-containing protein [Acidimicrobiales bacterium]|nr:EAL domain-containing protein [Acidimicrobiales bacterium]